jgi:hypothetical protein
MADRRQRKLEAKRKKRELDKKRARAEDAKRPSLELRQLAAAARGVFGPCAISAGWDDGTAAMPELVSVVVTRELPNGDFLSSLALVDRTCLGVKDGFAIPALGRDELPELFDKLFEGHGGWVECEPLVAQSVVFHAVDYAKRLGFEPHRDAKLELFGPRPAKLLETPLHARERPLYVAGPQDDAASIIARLEKALGPDSFEFFSPFGALTGRRGFQDDEDEADPFDDEEKAGEP